MFFRIKNSGPRPYLQVVENPAEGGCCPQRVLVTLGRLDSSSRPVSSMASSLPALAGPMVLLISEHAQGRAPAGPPAHRPRTGLRAALAGNRLPPSPRSVPEGSAL